MGDGDGSSDLRDALLDKAINRTKADPDIVKMARGYAELEELAAAVRAALPDPWTDVADVLERYEAAHAARAVVEGRVLLETLSTPKVRFPTTPSGPSVNVGATVAGVAVAAAGAVGGVPAALVVGIAVALVGGFTATRRIPKPELRTSDEVLAPPRYADDKELTGLAAMADFLEATLLEVFAERVLLPAFRSAIAERRSPSYALRLPEGDAPGLSQELPPHFQLQTAPAHQVAHMMRTMPGASIGVSGPRGSGKTTLINWFCSHDVDEKPTLAVRCDAPVEYEARDFLLHLFARLCEAIIGARNPKIQPPLSMEEAASRERRGRVVVRSAAAAGGIGLAVAATAWFASPTARLLGLAVAVAVVVGLTLIVFSMFPWRPFSGSSWGALGLGGALSATLVGFGELTSGVFLSGLLVGGFGAVVWREGSELQHAAARARRAAEWEEDAGFGLLVDGAAEMLERIRFHQTFSAGWSGKVAVGVKPLSGEVGHNETRTVAFQPWTLPDIVAELGNLLWRATSFRRVVIGIDELDKIGDEQAAGRFIDDIKGIFGVRECFFLVSVSEDAMASFERRGLPFRNAFDSAFTDIVHVPYATFADTRSLLESRVVGMPLPFMGLCHALAGGLPRDVIRVARKLYELPRPVPMADAARLLTAQELRGKLPAIAAALALIPREPATRRLLEWIDTDGLADATPGVLLPACARLLELLEPRQVNLDDEHGARLLRLRDELAAFTYFAATVVEFFALEQVIGVIQAAADDPEGHWFLRLADARQAFAVHPILAWKRIERFRTEAKLTVAGSVASAG